MPPALVPPGRLHHDDPEEPEEAAEDPAARDVNLRPEVLQVAQPRKRKRKVNLYGEDDLELEVLLVCSLICPCLGTTFGSQVLE